MKPFDKIAALYFEAHVTIEPIFDDKLEEAKQIAVKHGFKVASLLMKKRAEDTAERSQYDTFMTGHSRSYLTLTENTILLVKELQEKGFKVWRYKMEDTLFDSRTCDILGLLEETNDIKADM